MASLTKNELLKMVLDIRSRHDACTLGALALNLGVPKSNVQRAVYQMRDQGLLRFTDVAGSIQVTDAGHRLLTPPTSSTVTQSATPAEPAPATPSVKKVAKARKAAAPKVSPPRSRRRTAEG